MSLRTHRATHTTYRPLLRSRASLRTMCNCSCIRCTCRQAWNQRTSRSSRTARGPILRTTPGTKQPSNATATKSDLAEMETSTTEVAPAPAVATLRRIRLNSNDSLCSSATEDSQCTSFVGPLGSKSTDVDSENALREERAKLYSWMKRSGAWEVRGKGSVDFVMGDETGEARRLLYERYSLLVVLGSRVRTPAVVGPHHDSPHPCEPPPTHIPPL